MSKKQKKRRRAELRDRGGPYRSPILDPAYHRGRRPANYGMKLPAEPLTVSEARSLLAACSRRGAAGIRDRALYAVLWRCGLRISEALALELKDLNLDTGEIRVLHGKGDRDRVVGLDVDAQALLEQWLKVRATLGVKRTQPVFCIVSRPRVGEPQTASNVRKAMKLHRAKAGIEKRVHPHGLRHTHAYELSVEGVPVNVIQMQLGHGDLGTTARYINHLAPADRVRLMRGRRWTEET